MKNLFALLVVLLALVVPTIIGCGNKPFKKDKRDRQRKTTILQSTSYCITPWAVTDILPGGANTPFYGQPLNEQYGSDTGDRFLENVEIPGLKIPVSRSYELSLLNERNIRPVEIDGELFNFLFTLNPEKKSLGTITIVQTKEDDNGPGPEGFYLRETNIELLTHLFPLNGGDTIVIPGQVHITSPVPILFSFDPPSKEIWLKEGEIGDISANWHVNKEEWQKDFFSFPGMLQVPHGGRPLNDVLGQLASRGGSVSALLEKHVVIDNKPPRERFVDRSFTPMGVEDIDSNRNSIPDYYENNLLEINQSNETISRSNLSLIYDSPSGEITIQVPENEKILSFNISSSSGIFIGNSALNLDGKLDQDTDVLLLKIDFGNGFGTTNIGPVAQKDLTKEEILNDLTCRVLLTDGSSRGQLQLIYKE